MSQKSNISVRNLNPQISNRYNKDNADPPLQFARILSATIHLFLHNERAVIQLKLDFNFLENN